MTLARNALTRIKNTYQRIPRKWLVVIAIAFIVLLSVWFIHTYRKHQQRPGMPVTVSVAQQREVPVYLAGLGTVTPTNSVTVKTPVNGYLLNVLFQEGQKVKQGDLLAEIDPQPYLAQLKQYEGQLARDQALLDNARVDLKRYQTLWKQDSVAKQTLDTQVALVKQYEGTVKTDEGLIAGVKVNLNYAQIKSPVAGRIGLRLVDAGNYVQTADATGLAVVNTLDPITVVFALPESDIPRVSKQFSAHKTLLVQALDREQESLLAMGVLAAMDSQIDPTTGTVKLKAQFRNSDDQLFPNQFVNVRLLIETLSRATVVPTAAIQYGVDYPFVFLVSDNVAHIQRVGIGPSTDDDETVVTGVTPGEKVVIEGTDKLTDGITVAARECPMVNTVNKPIA